MSSEVPSGTDDFSPEICLIMSEPQGDRRILQDDGQLRELYGRVLEQLNAAGLRVSRLDSDGREPWVPLAAPGSSSATLFYHAEDESATILADEINRRILGADGIRTRLADVDLPWVAAFPNHSVKASQIGSDGGGPGCGPLSVPPSSASGPPFGAFEFSPKLNKVVNDPRPTPDVAVALLDTWSPLARPITGKNWLLQRIVAGLSGTPPVITVDRPAIPAVTSSIATDMSDHGLFNAGIIRSIATTVPMWAIRILNDNSAGEVESTFRGLGRLGHFSLLGSRLLILNMSLRFHRPAPPPPGSPHPVLTSGQQQTLLSGMIRLLFAVPLAKAQIAAAALLALGFGFHELVTEVLFWLAVYPHNVLIIAAAGNDGPDAADNPQQEAAPGRYSADRPIMEALLGNALKCQIIGVAAANRDASVRSLFTNHGDIATIGGDVQSPYHPVNISLNTLATLPSGERDAIVGVGTNEPASGSGWFYWAGTSFATAIVSGVAAAIAAHPTSAPDATALRTRVNQHRGHTAPHKLTCKPIKAKQL